jgi:proline iminopeptidase
MFVESLNPQNRFLSLLMAMAIPLAPFAYRGLARAQARQKAPINPELGIESLEEVTLGGLKQWILIRGRNVDNPVVLFLHGGPGWPLMPTYIINSPLEEHFTVVHWDQRGAGKSYNPDIPAEEMTLDRYIADAAELADILRARFDQSKIFVVGHSMGSVIGLNLANRHPDKVCTYVGLGQITNMAEGETRSYRFALACAMEKHNAIATRQLTALGEPPYKDARAVIVAKSWADRFGGNFHHNMSISRMSRLTFTCPYYTLADTARVPKGVEFTIKKVWQRLYDEVNFFEQVHHVQVPVFFIAGRYDMVVPQGLLKDYFVRLEAPQGKQLIWFEQSAHWPQLEEPERFHEVMVNLVRPQGLQQQLRQMAQHAE